MIEQILQADRLLTVDQVDKARRIYERVVELDPGNSIATVGLARCALADGDDVHAYELAAKALEIDPENDMARRMEARLSEVLATRGEPVARPGAASEGNADALRPVVTEEPSGRRQNDASKATVTTPTARTPTTATQRSFLGRLLGR